MKDDYLWDKSGFDPEIAALETKLSAFRSKSGTPPTVAVATELPMAEPRTRWRAFWPVWVPTFAAAAVIVAWFAIAPGPERHESVAVDNAVAAIPDREIAVVPRPPKVVVDPYVPERAIKRRPPKVVPERAPMPRPVVVNQVRNRPSVDSPVDETALTAEEKYAYDQLMLALSITGSKLKIVQDKIRHGDVPVSGGK